VLLDLVRSAFEAGDVEGARSAVDAAGRLLGAVQAPPAGEIARRDDARRAIAVDAKGRPVPDAPAKSAKRRRS
jgi:hypothetical protein